jgi:hypothetical protein
LNVLLTEKSKYSVSRISIKSSFIIIILSSVLLLFLISSILQSAGAGAAGAFAFIIVIKEIIGKEYNIHVSVDHQIIQTNSNSSDCFESTSSFH